MTEQNFKQMRHAMVASQLRTNAVDDPRVIDALTEVAREGHLPADKVAAAYIDRAVALPGGRGLNPPLTTARLINESHPQPTDKVLLVGAATGYAAALLGQLAGSVVALEESADLLDIAKAVTKAKAVKFVEGPLAAGWAEGAPYDVIIIDGAIEQLPDTLVDQLAEGGRLAAAQLDRGVTRLALGRKTGGGFALIPFLDAEAVALPGFTVPQAFTF